MCLGFLRRHEDERLYALVARQSGLIEQQEAVIRQQAELVGTLSRAITVLSEKLRTGSVCPYFDPAAEPPEGCS